jgi:pimeloyl-ACP methyl ester carboxylesterase
METPLEMFRAAPVQHLDLGSTKMAYRVFGSGPALVFVHGWPLSGVSFRALIARMRHHFTCYVPDLPGAGDSPIDPSMKDLFHDGARAIGTLVDALELDHFALIGFDSGGAMARIVAADRPGRVFALALTNTETPGHKLPLIKMFQRAASLPGATTAFKWMLGSKAFLRSKFGFKGTFANLDYLEDPEFRAATLEPLRRDPSGALYSVKNADLDIADHLDEIHARIDAPLLCVWGDRCGFFPVECAEAMVNSWPTQAHLEVVSGEKLLVHEEQPEAVLRAMLPFLREHAPPTLLEANAG